MEHSPIFITIQIKENANIENIKKEIGLSQIKQLKIKNFFSAQSNENTKKQIEELNKRNDVVIAYIDNIIPIKKNT
jgi:hypothetical protein